MIREGTGHLDTAKDLALLGAMFGSNWERVAGKVPFERALVDEAARLGTLLLRTIGAKEVGEARKDPSYDWDSLRARAFRLLVNALRGAAAGDELCGWHHGDGLAYAPSLHARPAQRRKGSNDAGTPAVEPLASEGVELGGNAPAAEAGLPGNNPFTRE